MEAQEDFKGLLELFNGHKVEYMIVGAYAPAYHGAPRFLVKHSLNNAQRILSALSDFGFGSLKPTMHDFLNPDSVIQPGVPPVRIDIIPSLTGVTGIEADQGKLEGLYGDIPVYFLGREQYIANQRAVGRKKDLADLESLGEE